MRLDTFESKFPEIQFVDEYVDYSDRIVFTDIVVKSLWKQCALGSVFAFNETFHGFVTLLVGRSVYLTSRFDTPSTRNVVNFWHDIALVSLFVQWVALSSAGLLCLLRPRLRAMNNSLAGAVGYGLILLVTLVLSEAAFWFVSQQIVQANFSTAWKFDSSVAWYDQRSRVHLPVTAYGHIEFLLRCLGISAIVSALALRYFYVQFHWKANLESESRARIQALQSRIRPHFLFNSMNTIASLTRTDPALAEQVTEDLADLFRVSLSDAGIAVALRDEIMLCDQYLRIEQQRLGDRLTMSWDTREIAGGCLGTETDSATVAGERGLSWH